jgi:hypothetical protein
MVAGDVDNVIRYANVGVLTVKGFNCDDMDRNRLSAGLSADVCERPVERLSAVYIRARHKYYIL